MRAAVLAALLAMPAVALASESIETGKNLAETHCSTVGAAIAVHATITLSHVT